MPGALEFPWVPGTAGEQCVSQRIRAVLRDGVQRVHHVACGSLKARLCSVPFGSLPLPPRRKKQKTKQNSPRPQKGPQYHQKAGHGSLLSPNPGIRLCRERGRPSSAFGLAHLLALLVPDQAVQIDLLEGRLRRWLERRSATKMGYPGMEPRTGISVVILA